MTMSPLFCTKLCPCVTLTLCTRVLSAISRQQSRFCFSWRNSGTQRAKRRKGWRWSTRRCRPFTVFDGDAD